MGWIEETKKARAEGSFQRAMEILSAEKSVRPEDPRVHLEIAFTHDSLGKEKDAVPAYEKAIELGLCDQELRDAYLGLGSTFRSMGEYEKSKDVFEKALKVFPEFRPFRVFYSLTLFNLGQHSAAMQILIKELVTTTSDEDIRSYQRALLFYSERLEETFE